MTYEIQRVDNNVINAHGWRIVRSDGTVLFPFFTTRRGAERLIEFFNPGKAVSHGN
jgi:hypothetical protein